LKRLPAARAFVRFAPYTILFGGRGGSFVFALAALLLLAVSLARPGALSGARMAASDLMTPLLSAFSRPFQDAAAVIGNVSGFASLKAENEQLRAENTRLREWYQSALMLQAENQTLQQLLNLKPDPRHSFVTARVVADTGNAYVRTVLLSAGEDDGVAKGQAVLSGEGLVGRVIETGRSSSRVLLVTDLNSRIPVMVEGSRQKAILSGTNSDVPVLRHLPPDSEVREGMRIVTSGDGGIFPPGLPVGRVGAVQGISWPVRPFADLSRVTHVRVVDVPDDPHLIEARP